VTGTTPGSRDRTTPGAIALATPGLCWFFLVAHAGPPFPIVTGQAAGRYEVAIWTDPDATDDAQLGGQFWVVLKARDAAVDVPAGTRVLVAIRALDRPGAVELSATAAPVDGLLTRQFAALRMDHEGRFAVRVAIDGPLGAAQVTSAVDATYDLRPAPALFVVYLAPFLVLGLLWIKLLRRRRALRRGEIQRPPAR
jgi:hypothetical protein